MERYARELSGALAERLGAGSVALEHPVACRGLAALMDVPRARWIDRAWSRYVTYPATLRHRRADVFHILDQAYAHLIRRLDAEHTVVTCHDLIPLLAADGVVPVQVPRLVVRTFRWRVHQMAAARKVIAVSRATQEALARYTPVRPDRIAVVPQGVNRTFRVLEGRKPALRAARDLPAAAAVLLHVATRDRYKNTPVLLQALAGLRRLHGKDIILARVGAPLHPDEADLARRLGVGDAVRYAGFVDEESLVEWYNAADVFVFPSSWEGFGWPPLEAMACGTPVVASDVPALTEVVGDAGLLVPSTDPSAVADAVERVLTDRALADSLRQRGRARAARFTWEQTAAATAAVYQELLQ